MIRILWSGFFACGLLFATAGTEIAAAVTQAPPSISSLPADQRAALTRAQQSFRERLPNLTGAQLGVAHGRLALHYYSHGFRDSAEAALLSASELDPENFQWPYYLALLALDESDGPAAQGWLQKSLDLNAGNVPAMTRLGLLLEAAGQTANAEAMLRRAIETAPGNAVALTGLARIEANRRDWTGAIGHLEAALRSQPRATSLHMPLAMAYRESGDAGRASEHEQRIGTGAVVIDDPLHSFMQAHRKGGDFYFELGEAALRAGDDERAVRLFYLAASIDPGNAGAVRRLDELRGVQTAAAEATAALAQPGAELAPAQIAYQRGRALEMQANESAARDSYRRALELDAGLVGPRLLLANSLMRAGEFDAAAAAYGEVAARLPTDPEYRYREGLAWLAAGVCDAAERALLAGFAVDNSAARIVQALVRAYSTCAQVEGEKRRQALAYAQGLYNGAPGLETAATLAMAMAANGEYAEAADYQRQAIFEALKAGTLERHPELAANLDKYVAEQTATEAWPVKHAVFSPPRLGS